jgi:ribosomal subunit interface protein
MNLLFHHGHLRRSVALEHFVESRLLALEARQRIAAAEVHLVAEPDASPRYRASVLLRMPGPDIHASARDHTVRGALERTLDAAEEQLNARQDRRRARRRTELQHTAAPRTGRAG